MSAMAKAEKERQDKAKAEQAKVEKQRVRVDKANAKADKAKVKGPVAPLPPVTQEAPPPPISAAKLKKLAELNEAYAKDQITPAEYHARRARIISGPEP